MANFAAFACLTLLFALPLLVYSEDCVQIIHLKTGDVDGAGTDADVALYLYDAQGNRVGKSDITPSGIMEEGHDYYERDSLDVFAFRSECLASEVCKIELSNDNSGSKSGWYVSYLSVTTTTPNSIKCSQNKFNIDQWLALDEYPYSLSVSKDKCAKFQGNNTDSAIDSVLNLPSSDE